MMAKRIVVIDNDPWVLDVIQEALIDEGFNVEIFEGTDDIAGLVRQCQPDLVILDYILEGINGGELCRQIKKQAATTKLPVMICSAYPRVLQSLGFYDCDAFMEKPFNLIDLLAKVNALISRNAKMSVLI